MDRDAWVVSVAVSGCGGSPEHVLLLGWLRVVQATHDHGSAPPDGRGAYGVGRRGGGGWVMLVGWLKDKLAFPGRTHVTGRAAHCRAAVGQRAHRAGPSHLHCGRLGECLGGAGGGAGGEMVVRIGGHGFGMELHCTRCRWGCSMVDGAAARTCY